jgi:hypothetical protein
MRNDELVAFDHVAHFDVLDGTLAGSVGGGSFFSVSKEGDTRMDHQCVSDNHNTQCIAPNNFCGTNVVCPEVDAGPI